MSPKVVSHRHHLLWKFVAILGGVTLSACARAANLPTTTVPFAAPEPAPVATLTAIVINVQSTAIATDALVVPATPMPAPPLVLIATACVPQLTTNNDVVIRAGYSRLYSVLGNLLPNSRAPVIAQSPDGAWLEIVAAGGQQGWLESSQVTAQCVNHVPVVQLVLPSVTPIPTLMPTPKPTPIPFTPVPLPRLSITFWADSMVIFAGQCTTLHWSVINAVNGTDVYLNDGNGDGSVAAQGARQICPTATMAYQLKLTQDDPSLNRPVTQRILTVHVNGLPTPHTSFWSANPSIALGACTTLFWEIDNVQGVYLNEGNGDQGVAGHDSHTVCPQTTTTYSLRVVQNNGQATQQFVTVSVGPSAQPTLIPTLPPAPTVAAATITPIP